MSSAKSANSVLVNLEDVTFTYPSQGSPSLEGINFSIYPQEIIACLGPNGGGKTTLMKLITGIHLPHSGKVSRHIDLAKIGYTPQRYYINKNFPGTVEEILSLGKALTKGNQTPSQDWIDQVDFRKIEGILKKRFIDLSGGQQQQVLLALALARKPRLLILDEPTSGVDTASRRVFYHRLSELNQDGVAILIITHETHIPLNVNRILYLNRKGQVGDVVGMGDFLANLGIEIHTAENTKI